MSCWPWSLRRHFHSSGFLVSFDFLYLAGSGATGSVVGEPYLAVMTETEFANIARMMTMHTDLPIVADADTGFGGPLNIRRTYNSTSMLVSQQCI